MRKNELREIWKNNKIAINAWLAIPNSQTAEIIANHGFDSVTIDMQHGMIGFEIAFQMLQRISTSDAIPLVRLPWNDRSSDLIKT